MEQNNAHQKYEVVIGLEVHTQLLTQSKAFAPDSAAFEAMPNQHVSPISLGHPGTLPKLNDKVLDYAIRIGLATHCNIRTYNEFARKNYFYADLPKGYQITQHLTPICFDGYVDIKTDDGKTPKRIGITRIHIEEDAGKSTHDQDIFDSLIDINRCGVPLLEVVSEPDLRSAQEAYDYLFEIRKLVRYLDICDGNMEEGSMRCDANVSVRLRGETTLGNKVEVKNMNSITNVKRAIEFEIKRQIELAQKGEYISSDTRSFDASNGSTFLLRSKEMANDYRYFPEPDLLPLIVSDEKIEAIRAKMPLLPHELVQKFTTQYHLSPYDAGLLTDSKPIALYFEQMAQHTKHYKLASNWLMGTIKSYLNNEGLEIGEFQLKPKQIIEIIDLIESNKISNTVAAQRVFPELIKNPSKNAEQIAKDLNLIQDSDSDSINGFVKQVLANYPEKVAEYRAGKKGLAGLFVGEAMKLSGGKANPKLLNKLVIEALEN